MFRFNQKRSLFIPYHICTSGVTHPLPCERGFYCPGGSANQHPCPAGTYGNMSGLVEEWQCSMCDPGMYCKGTGTMEPLLWLVIWDVSTLLYRSVPETVNGCSVVEVIKALVEWYLFKGRTFASGPCAAGFVCVGGASESSPLDNVTGFPCPPGFFCSVGTSSPKACPKGTFRCTPCNISTNVLISISLITVNRVIHETHFEF